MLASLNEATVDSDDNDGNDRESLSRRLLDKQFESSLPEVNYLTARDDVLRRTDVPERLQVCIWFPSPPFNFITLSATVVYFVYRRG